jgi:hypothetical protein
MPWAVAGAALAAAGSVGGGIIGGNAQKSAADAEVAAEQQALQFQEGVYDTATTNLDPYISSGKNALYSIDSLYGLPGAPGTANTGTGAEQTFQNFTNTPAYSFGLNQGELGANRSLAAQGLTGSGAAAKALDQYAQGYASQQFGGYVNQLQQLAGMGQSAATSLGGIGNQTGAQVGATEGAIGTSRAAGIIGPANSLTQGLGQAGGFLSSALNNPNVQNALSGLGGSSYSDVGAASLNGGQPYTQTQYPTLNVPQGEDF